MHYIYIKQIPTYHMIHDQNILKPTTVTLEQFSDIFMSEYKQLQKTTGTSYVNIPNLRHAITAKLKNKTWRVLHFENYLLQIIHQSNNKITLHQTGIKSRGGIFRNGNYYHFITIQN